MKKLVKLTSYLLIAGLFVSFTACGGSSTKTDEGETEVAATTEPETTTEPAEDWVSIFDGKTSEGWRSYGKETFPEKGWTIEDGVLHVHGSGKGEAGGGGDIITTKKYKNFELSLEWKVSEGGNSGIFYLVQEKPDQAIWKSGLEMQILDNEKHPDGKLGVDGNRRAGALYDLIPPRPETVKPVGEWNHIKIMVYKGTVVYWMNGQNVLEFHLWTDDWKKMVAGSKFKDYADFVNPAEEGYIGLQDHGDDVWFRNIKIREL